MAINPYSDWLGIDESIVSPNYFELLGVNPTIEDETVLIRSVTEGARRKLAMLASVDSVKFAEPVAKLKARISKAAAVLSDPKLRSEYCVALSRQTQSGTETPSSGGLERVTTSVPSTSSNKSKPLNPTPQSPKRPLLPAPVGKKPAEAETESKVSEAEDDIPMAIPIRKVPSASPPAPPLNQVNEETDSQTIPRFLSDPPEGIAAEEAEAKFLKSIGSDSLKVRKKRGIPIWVTGIAVMLLIVCIGGLLWSIQFFSNPENLASSKDKGTIQTGNSSDPISSIGRIPVPAESTAKVDKDDSAPSVDDTTMVADSDSQADSSAPDNTEVGSTEVGSTEVGSKPPEEQPSAQPDSDKPGLWELYFSNRKIRWIRRLLARREYDKARAEIASLEKSLERFPQVEKTSEDFEDSLDQTRKDLESVKDAMARIDEFWMTVKSNLAKFPPAAELKFDGKPMLLVDKTDVSLQLRGAGTNYQFTLNFLPLEYARQIAEQGTIDDIPTWRLCLAAAISAENGEADQNEEVEKLVEASEGDGHDTSLLSEFIHFDSKIRVEWDRAKLKDGNERKKIVADYKNQFDYKDIKSLAPEKASQIFDSYFEAEEQDVDVAATLLSEAIELAIQSRDPYRLEDAIMELGGVANIDEARLQLDSLIKLSTAKLKPDQVLKLRRVARKHLNKENEHSFPKLTKRLTLLLTNLSKEASIENEGIKSGQLR